MAKFNPPEQFTFDPVLWSDWRQRWARYSVISKLDKQTEELQVDALLYSMGPQAEVIFRGLDLTAEDQVKIKEVLKAFETYFMPRKYVIFERAKFYRRQQQEGESAEQYIRALRELADRCEFADKSTMVRDKLVVGILDGELSKQMQKMDVGELTEHKAATMVRQAESVDKQCRELKSLDQSETVSAVSYKEVKSCRKCMTKHKSGECPAKDRNCRICDKKGHYAKACFAKKPTKWSKRSADQVEADERCTGFLDEICGKRRVPWNKQVRVNGNQVRFKLDSGADVSVVNESVVKGPLEECDRQLYGPGRHKIKVRGKTQALLEVNGRSIMEMLYVVPEQRSCLLSRAACLELGLIKLNVEVDRVSIASGEKFKEKFKRLFVGLGKIANEANIELQEDSRSYAVQTPRSVPYPLQKVVKEELDKMVKEGVIFPVEKPTDWCAPMVVVPKPNSKVRICVDYTKLNKEVKREVYPMAHVESSLAKLGAGKIFTKLDANSGFYQIPLSSKSKLLTTFLTPFGRFAYNRLPFGLSSSPEIYSKVMTVILSGLQGIVVHMDDVLIWGQTEKEHDERVNAVLKRMSDSGITLNEAKCEFSQSQIKFWGHIISASGFQANPDAVQGLKDFETPKNVHEVRSFLGMANQLSKFSTNLGKISGPLRELLHKDIPWMWGIPQEESFSKIKSELSKNVELAAYNPDFKTIIQADACREGIGAALFQKQPDNSVRLVGCASRSLNETEKRYATIEQEALGIVWACEKFKDYIIGLKVLIQTDHKPLVPLLGEIELYKLPVRVQRFRIRLMRYHYEMEHIKGKLNVVADALSRSTNRPDQEDSLFSVDTEEFTEQSLIGVASTKKLCELRGLQRKDEVMAQVINYVKTSWPVYLASEETLIRPYFENRTRLSFVDDILVMDGRIVIPQSERLVTLTKLHEGHLGITKCRDRAKTIIWWPGMSAQIAEMVKACNKCRVNSNIKYEPLLCSQFPSRPWSRLGSDLFYLNNQWYLLVVDYFSRYVEIAALQKLDSKEVIDHLKSIFARHGIPDVMISDNGPQYASLEFRKFVAKYSFTHITSSPVYPKSNGLAERTVQTVKNMLKKEQDADLALLAYRSSPLENGLSPAELLMGRKLKTTLPVLPAKLQPRCQNNSTIIEKEEKKRSASTMVFNHRHKAVDLPVLHAGDKVYIRDMQRHGEVIGNHPETPRSYMVKDGNKRMVRRNRQSLTALSKEHEEKPQENTIQVPDSTPNFSRYGRQIKAPEVLDL